MMCAYFTESSLERNGDIKRERVCEFVRERDSERETRGEREREKERDRQTDRAATRVKNFHKEQGRQDYIAQSAAVQHTQARFYSLIEQYTHQRTVSTTTKVVVFS